MTLNVTSHLPPFFYAIKQMLKLTILILFTLIVSKVVSTKTEFERRIVALGDLHGDLPNTLAILKFSNIIDDDHHWIGGDAIFVQTVKPIYRPIKLFVYSNNFFLNIGRCC